MKITVRCADPYQKPDGTWDLREYDREEEIPDLGRPDILCNKCGWSTYPECREWCRNARLDREKEREQKAAE